MFDFLKKKPEQEKHKESATLSLKNMGLDPPKKVSSFQEVKDVESNSSGRKIVPLFLLLR